MDQIGEELNVAYVLEGSAQREDNRVRIAAQLIHAKDQTQIWADTFEPAEGPVTRTLGIMISAEFGDILLIDQREISP